VDISTTDHNASRGLPAQRIDSSGRAHVDVRAVLALALPLVANSAVQTILNLTDLWFVGRISTKAVAAVGAVHWLVLVVVLILSGIGAAVQTVAAQAYGGRRYARAARAAWIALWGTLCTVPLFVAAAFSGGLILAPFGLDPEVEQLAIEFWLPRVAGAPFGAAVWAMLGFFNGTGRPRISVLITVAIALLNAVLNELFIFQLDGGVAGSAWATTTAQALGLLLAVAIFLRPHYRELYRSHLTWRPKSRPLLQQFRLGLPMGLLYAADLFGISVFQLMIVRLGAADGAASQIVLVLTSMAYLPGFGIALAGTTLVGQAIGAGDRDWAMRLGTFVIWLAAFVMGGIGVMLAAAGPWVLPFFLGAQDADATAVVRLGLQLLWIAAAYQFFDGLNLGAGLCLRGAGDALVPAALVIVLSWFFFVPLAHTFTFGAGQGWVDGAPQMGWGAHGGWTALVVYILLLGAMLFARWRSAAWKRITI
jgi:multidrug resistance protein, MATE family